MSDISARIRDLHTLETLSRGKSVIHRLHPMAKLVSCLVFIVAVVSFDRYGFTRLAPYAFYPFVLMALSDVPYAAFLKRLWIPLPFCLFAGISNVILDTSTAFSIGTLSISFGVLSLATILLKMVLTVMAALLLVATTPMAELTAQLRFLHVPGIFVTIFEMTYRYIGVLLEETLSMSTAYGLRHTRKKGIEMRHMGSFVGQLILKSLDRAERVYGAMKCRGYSQNMRLRWQNTFQLSDGIFLAIVSTLAVLLRIVSVESVLKGVF
jgi:cobalt/nickel transport system permease protein